MLSIVLNKKTFFQKLFTKRNFWVLGVVLCLIIPTAVFATELNISDIGTTEEDAGGGMGGLVAKGFLWVISYFLYIIFKFVGIFLSIALKLLGAVVSAELFNAMFSTPSALAALNAGWAAVRDFFNMFFILIFLFIAISIILGISKYNDKSNIVKVVIAAVLINFSKAITLFVIDISQLAMNFFASAIRVDSRGFEGLIAEKMGMNQFFSLSFGDGSAFLVSLIFAIIFVIIMTSMIFTLTFALVVRLIAFWVLIILSPIAMFGIALPNSVGGSLTGNWFKKLMSWAFFGPIMMFFLWLALVVVSAIYTAMGTSGVADRIVPNVQGTDHGYLSTIGGILMPFAAGIYLLYYGFDLSQKISQGFATTVLNKGKDWTNSALKGSGKITASLLTGGLATKAGMEGMADSYENSALGRNRFTRLATEKGRKRRAEEVRGRFSGEKGKQSAERKRVNEELKRFKDEHLSDDDIKEKLKDPNSSKEIKLAAARHLAEKGKLNDAESYEKAKGAVDSAKDESIKKNFENDAKKHNSYGRYLYNKKEKIEEVKREGVLVNDDDIKREATKRARKEIKKELRKKNLEEVMKQDAKLLRSGNILKDVEKKHGRDALANILRQGKLSGEKAEIIKRHLGIP